MEEDAWYAQLVIRFGRWAGAVQFEGSELLQCATPFQSACPAVGPLPGFVVAPHVERTGRDLGLGISHRLRHDLILKGEWHDVDGQALELAYGFVPGRGGGSLTRRDPANNGAYVLVTAAWSY